MFRKWTAFLTVFVFCCSMLGPVYAAGEPPVVARISSVERMLYGAVQTGAILERVTKLENEIYGLETEGAILDRVDRLHAEVFDNANGQASFLTKINAIEWLFKNEVTSAPIKTRVENLETQLEGNPKEGTLSERITALSQLAFPEGVIEVADRAVPAETLIKIKLLTPLDSETTGVGNEVRYQVAEDVVLDGSLVFAAGAEGSGVVAKVSEAQNFGRNAKLEVDFQTITALDGRIVDTVLGEKAKEETERLAVAAGATVAGLALLGPVGIVAGAFVKGKDIKIPAGTEMYIQTKTDVIVYGILTNVSSN